MITTNVRISSDGKETGTLLSEMLAQRGFELGNRRGLHGILRGQPDVTNMVGWACRVNQWCPSEVR